MSSSVNSQDLMHSLADALGLVRAQRAGDAAGAAEAIYAMSGTEIYRGFLAMLAIASRLAAEVDQVRASAGDGPGHADALLAHLAEYARSGLQGDAR